MVERHNDSGDAATAVRLKNSGRSQIHVVVFTRARFKIVRAINYFQRVLTIAYYNTNLYEGYGLRTDLTPC